LCACFDFALNDKTGLDGVFRAIRDCFRLPGSRKLFERLTTVNEFRNTYVAHHEKELSDKALAERNLNPAAVRSRDMTEEGKLESAIHHHLMRGLIDNGFAPDIARLQELVAAEPASVAAALKR
jgi:hypothetical protein